MNPIYERLTRRSRWLSRRTVVWIGMVIGLLTLSIGLIGILAPVQMGELRSVALLAPLLAGAGYIAMMPPLALMVTAIGVVRYVATEDFAQLRLTNVSSKAIVEGYYQAASDRLGGVWALGIGLVPGVWLAISNILMQVGGMTCAIGESPPYSCLGMFCIMFPMGGIVFGIIVVLVRTLGVIAVKLGILLGMLFPNSAPLVAAGFITVQMTLLLSVVVVPILFGLYIGVFVVAALCASALPLAFVLPILNNRLLGWAAARVERIPPP